MTTALHHCIKLWLGIFLNASRNLYVLVLMSMRQMSKVQLRFISRQRKASWNVPARFSLRVLQVPKKKAEISDRAMATNRNREVGLLLIVRTTKAFGLCTAPAFMAIPN